MSSVAEQLRNAREKSRLSVYDVADVTKIRTDHVRALEEGNYDVFAAPVYIRGFVRSYAKLVKLDLGRIMEDLDAELSATDKFREPPNLAGRSTGALDVIMLRLSKLNWQLVVLLVGLALVILVGMAGYRTWQRRRIADPFSGLGNGLYRPADTNSGELLPLPSALPPK